MKKYLYKIIPKTCSHKRGFTIVETLVAIFILLISITGPMFVAQNGLRTAFIARDQVVAFYLAQDAIEAIKNARENRFINVEDWLADVRDTCIDEDGCTIDTTVQGLEFDSCTNPSSVGCSIENPLKIDSSRNYVFGFDGDIDSNFYRIIHIDEFQFNQEAEIKVEVGWKNPNGEVRNVVVRENIFRWAPVYDLSTGDGDEDGDDDDQGEDED